MSDGWLGANTSVVLLRSERLDDPYRSVLSAAGFDVRYEPVLYFAFEAQDELAERLARPDDYAGLILTSPRSARALAEVVRENSPIPEKWRSKVAYVVGPRTAEVTRPIGLEVRGASAGRAEELAERIPPADKPLLFLAGSRRRQTLPDRLDYRGVAFEELCVYHTLVRSDLDADDLRADWLVFFSPSGIEAVPQAVLQSGTLHIASIGPTTAGALRKRGYEPQAVADQPTPASLRDALLRAIRRGDPT